MKYYTWLLGLLIPSSFLALTQTTFSAEGMREKHSQRHQEFMDKLGLSKEQSEEIKKLRVAHKNERKDLKVSVREGQKKLHEAMKGKASDEELKEMFAKIQNSRQKLAEMRFEHLLAVRKILTPEQRQKFREVMEEHRAKKGWKKDRGASDSED